MQERTLIKNAFIVQHESTFESAVGKDPESNQRLWEGLVGLNKTQEVALDRVHYALSDFSLFEGWKPKGWPIMNMINGEIVMRDGKIIAKPGTGKYLPRSP